MPVQNFQDLANLTASIATAVPSDFLSREQATQIYKDALREMGLIPARVEEKLKVEKPVKTVEK